MTPEIVAWPRCNGGLSGHRCEPEYDVHSSGCPCFGLRHMGPFGTGGDS
jgi:hypothetical protein